MKTLDLEPRIDTLVQNFRNKADGLFPKILRDLSIIPNALVNKTNGLFPHIRAKLNITAKDMVYIGDSYERDMVPAMECRILSIHFAENEGFDVLGTPMKIILWVN